MMLSCEIVETPNPASLFNLLVLCISTADQGRQHYYESGNRQSLDKVVHTRHTVGEESANAWVVWTEKGNEYEEGCIELFEEFWQMGDNLLQFFFYADDRTECCFPADADGNDFEDYSLVPLLLPALMGDLKDAWKKERSKK